ncbi:hypothetical protein Tco_0487600 [Tanacetum coccineum]
MNELVNDGIKLLKLEINTGFINGLPKKWLAFCQSLRNTNHLKESELASLFGKLKYKENLIDNIYETDKKKNLVSATSLSTAFFYTSIVQDFKDSPDDEEDTRSKVSSDDNEAIKVKALMALADEERVSVGKESARTGEWVKVSMKKVDTLLKMEDNDDRKSFLDYLSDNSMMSIPDGERPCLFEAEDLILPNHDADRILLAESQRKTTYPPVAFTDSLATDYDSADKSSVCSTPLPPQERLVGAELVLSIWKAFGGNTRDFGSFGEETDKTTDLHQLLSRISTQKLETASRITHDAVITYLKTTSQDLKTTGPHDTQYCMEDPKKAFVEYASSRTDEAGGEMTNKIDTMLKAITNQIVGTLPSDTVKKPKLGTHLVSSARSYPTIDPQWSSHPSNSINVIKAHFKEITISQTSLRQSKIETKLPQPEEPKPPQPEEPKPTLKDEFHDLHLNLPVLKALAHTPIYNAILVKYVESLELGKNESTFVQGEIPAKIEDPGLFTLPCRLRDSKPFDTLADLRSCVNIIYFTTLKSLTLDY